MKQTRMHSRNTFCRLISILLIAVMLIGVMPVYAEEAAVPEEKAPFKGSISLKLGTHGFGSASAILEFLTFSLGIDTEVKAADLNVALFGKGVDLIFAWDEESLRFTVPEAGKEVYALGKDLVSELFGMAKELVAKAEPAKLVSDASGFLMEQFRSLVQSAASSGHATDEESTYTYELLDGTGEGRTFTVTLSLEQWKSFWKQLGAILGENNGLIGKIVRKFGLMPKEIGDDLTVTEENAEELARKSKDWKLILFYDNDTVHAFRLGSEKNGLLFEKNGAVSDGGRNAAAGIRRDGKASRVLLNTMVCNENGFFGKLTLLDLLTLDYTAETMPDGRMKVRLDLSYNGKGISLDGIYTPGAVNISVPGTPDRTVCSINELTDVLADTVQKALSKLRIF